MHFFVVNIYLITIFWVGRHLKSLFISLYSYWVRNRLKGNLVKFKNYPRSCNPVSLLRDVFFQQKPLTAARRLGRGWKIRKVRRPAKYKINQAFGWKAIGVAIEFSYPFVCTSLARVFSLSLIIYLQTNKLWKHTLLNEMGRKRLFRSKK